MTNLNERIAIARGWTACTDIGGWVPPKQGEQIRKVRHSLPNFEGDANLYMQLYFELPTDKRVQLATVPQERFPHEVCLAWCRMNNMECEK